MNRMIDIKLALFMLSPLEFMNESWAVTGGANLYIRGMSKSINDVDIITSEKGVLEIIKLLSNQCIVIRPIQRTRYGNVESLFAKIECGSGFIEVMGNPANCIAGDWIKNERWNKKIEFINRYDFTKLPLMSLIYEREINTLLSNSERVTIIKNITKKSSGQLKAS